MLGKMGFSNVDITNSGAQAHEYIQKRPIDFLITEWNVRDIDGISLINQIRRDTASSNPLLPILMLTGRAEHTDVAIARDTGINEYVVKPFSAKTIYSRLERLIEQPRQFIAAPTFVGPDRRHKGSPPPGISNRRILNIAAKPHAPKETRGELIGTVPKVWTPDFSLKQKLGAGQNLQNFITPAVLNNAQASIDAITADSLQWIKEDLAQLKLLHDKMVSGQINTYFLDELSEIALTINSRAGTFGYGRAAEIAYKLYLFCRNKIRPDDAHHQIIVKKHIEVLQVIFGSNMLGMGGKAGEQIAMELHNLMLKYAP